MKQEIEEGIMTIMDYSLLISKLNNLDTEWEVLNRSYGSFENPTLLKNAKQKFAESLFTERYLESTSEPEELFDLLHRAIPFQDSPNRIEGEVYEFMGRDGAMARLLYRDEQFRIDSLTCPLWTLDSSDKREVQDD